MNLRVYFAKNRDSQQATPPRLKLSKTSESSACTYSKRLDGERETKLAFHLWLHMMWRHFDSSVKKRISLYWTTAFPCVYHMELQTPNKTVSTRGVMTWNLTSKQSNWTSFSDESSPSFSYFKSIKHYFLDYKCSLLCCRNFLVSCGAGSKL